VSFYRILITFFICFLVQACTCMTPYTTQELYQGKITFNRGEFQEAFCQLLPIAVNGNCEAQYAVGYMYYYGYGVPRDCTSGIFWMKKAAMQRYAPAMRALVLIQSPQSNCLDAVPGVHHGCGEITCDSNSSSGNHVCTHACPSQPVFSGEKSCHQDLVLQSIQRERVKAPTVKPSTRRQFIPITEETHPKKINSTQKLASSLKTSLNNHYSLQLFGAYHLADVKQLQKKLHATNSTHIYLSKNNGRDWYVLTYGKFATATDAKAAKLLILPEFSKLGPWIKNTDGLESVG